MKYDNREAIEAKLKQVDNLNNRIKALEDANTVVVKDSMNRSITTVGIFGMCEHPLTDIMMQTIASCKKYYTRQRDLIIEELRFL